MDHVLNLAFQYIEKNIMKNIFIVAIVFSFVHVP